MNHMSMKLLRNHKYIEIQDEKSSKRKFVRLKMVENSKKWFLMMVPHLILIRRQGWLKEMKWLGWVR